MKARTIRAERRRAAYHEAGHAVARRYVGIDLTPVEIGPHGSGFSHGTGEHIRRDDFLLILLAGPYAEARARKCARIVVLLTNGTEDWQLARKVADEWNAIMDDAGAGRALASQGMEYDRDAMLRWAGRMADVFLREHWRDVEKVAAALMERNRLEAHEVAELLEAK